MKSREELDKADIKRIENVVFDVDGVLTDGKFYYTENGKTIKVFGSEDTHALKILSKYLNIYFVSGDDFIGLKIIRQRMDDIGFQDLDLGYSEERLTWIRNKFPDLAKVCYMGDSIVDVPTLNRVSYSIAPQNRNPLIDPFCNYITNAKGGEGAVAEACYHILDKFFDVSYLNIEGYSIMIRGMY